MDRQEIFDGLLEELSSSDLIDEHYRLRKNEIAEHDVSTLPYDRLLAMGELVLDMNRTYAEIVIAENENRQITRTVEILRKNIFTPEESEILIDRDYPEIQDLMVNTDAPKSITIAVRYKSHKVEGNSAYLMLLLWHLTNFSNLKIIFLH